MQKVSGAKAARLIFFCVAAVIAAPAQTFETVADFSGTDGITPSGALVLGVDGNLYGTTLTGGKSLNGGSYCTESGCGTIFQMIPGGVLTTLYNFCSLAKCADGAAPGGALVQNSAGNFYGTTYSGGINSSNGTVFQITTGGVLTTLHSFCSLSSCADGSLPEPGLVEGSGGKFYGTTRAGGAKGGGTFFEITPGGTLTTLYSFCSLSKCADGMWPEGGLVLGSDGNFYGATRYGGTDNSDGTVFKITSGGVLTTLYSFCSLANCADGALPEAGLVQGSDGNFYGTTYYGGTHSNGTVFKITARGVLTTLYSFCSLANCADGALPEAGLAQGSDGNFYGTTTQGGTPLHRLSRIGCLAGCGTFFRITSAGTLGTLWNFCTNTSCADGSFPAASAIQLTNGTFYSTTLYGSGCTYNPDGGCGTVFSVASNVALAPTFTPTSLIFGKQAVGTTSKAKSVIIKNVNTGAATLELSGFTVSAPFALSDNTCGATLAAGKSCIASITFTPTATGSAAGTLSVSDNGPNSPQTVSLSGTGD